MYIIINILTLKGTIMAQKRKVAIMPQVEKNLKIMGEQIKLARLRRKYKAELIARRAGISRQTLWKVENGDPGVAMGIYAKVLTAIGLPDDITLLARDDELGRFLQDAELLNKGTKDE
jgi:transcriptional regulator with XRE-family HTH domain